MLSLIKIKLKSLSLAFIGILAVTATFLYALLQKEKKERIEDDLDIAQETQELSDKATEAMVKGLEDENSPIIRNNKRIG